jgi:hypothetical protein
MKECSFVVACSEFFGKRDGQSSLSFLKEIQQLTPEDKAELIVLFAGVGYTITK